MTRRQVLAATRRRVAAVTQWIETWTGTTGAAWSASNWSNTSACTIQTNRGRIAPSGAYVSGSAYFSGMAATRNTDVLVTFRQSAINESYLTISAQAPASVNPNTTYWGNYGYGVEITVASGASTVKLFRLPTATTQTQVASASGPTMTAATDYKLRFQTVGGLIQARVWAAAGAEPSTWTVSYSDATPLTDAGVVRLHTMTDASGTNNSEFDDLTVTAL